MPNCRGLASKQKFGLDFHHNILPQLARTPAPQCNFLSIGDITCAKQWDSLGAARNETGRIQRDAFVPLRVITQNTQPGEIRKHLHELALRRHSPRSQRTLRVLEPVCLGEWYCERLGAPIKTLVVVGTPPSVVHARD